MMQHLISKTCLACVAWTVLIGTARADVLSPNDDSYIDQGTPDAIRDYPPTPATTSTGILIKGQTNLQRIGFAEFTLPNVTVTSAILHIFHTRSFGVGSPTNDWVLRISGREDSFDESLITWNNTATTLRANTGTYTNIGSTLTMSGGISGDGQDVNQWRILDMTTFFNAHKGTNVVLRFVNTDNSGSKGGTLEDREGSRTGNPANGMYIEYTSEPVPNQPPTSILTACPTNGRAPLDVHFDASGSSDFDGTIVSYQWDFDGDGTTDQTTATATVLHTYVTPGTYNAKVTTVDDDSAGTTSTPVTITVAAGAPLLIPITDMLPTGNNLTGVQNLTSVTAGGNTFTSLTGPPDTAHIEIDGTGIGAADTLVGLDLSTAMLGLPTTPGSAIRAFFDRPIAADGTDKPEIFVLDWAASTDNFTVDLLTSGPGETVVVAGSVPVLSCQYAGTATVIHVTAGNQPVGGIGINLDGLGVTGIKGIQIPSAGNSPGVDPCVVAAVVKPCSIPFADADGDKDVDQDDFAIFQKCYTGAGNTSSFDPVNCICFDRDVKDNDVDEFDLTAFKNCRTAPGVQWKPELTPDCVP